MELISELIAIDDEAKKLVQQAQQQADELKEQAAGQVSAVREDNSKKLSELKAGSDRQITDATEEARASGEAYKSEKKAALDEYFTAHESEMVKNIVSSIYTVK
ncbi:MAG: hypothetical protein IKR76_00835 [Ruminococcus sp.]|nr:hypothetical protein [Ruminococcus sp.]